VLPEVAHSRRGSILKRTTVGNLEERIAFLEGRVSEHARGMDGIRDALVHLEERMDRRFHAVDLRFESIERQFDEFEERLDRRFNAVDLRFEGVDRRFEGVERRLESLEDKMSRHFVWLVGIQVTTLAAIVAALVARP
jgi:uncharacterized coiled-coil protein SlyX